GAGRVQALWTAWVTASLFRLKRQVSESRGLPLPPGLAILLLHGWRPWDRAIRGIASSFPLRLSPASAGAEDRSQTETHPSRLWSLPQSALFCLEARRARYGVEVLVFCDPESGQ